jgi:hypothetical protein
MGDYDRSIHSNPDAAAWAAFFIKTWKEIRTDAPPDEAWMLGWFANAMMAMHDAGPHAKELTALRARVAALEKERDTERACRLANETEMRRADAETGQLRAALSSAREEGARAVEKMRDRAATLAYQFLLGRSPSGDAALLASAIRTLPAPKERT